MKAEDILNYKPKQKIATAKTRALRLLLCFMALMVLCTLLSRAASNATMPQVVVEKPTRSAIAHVVQAEGVVQAGKQEIITGTAGIMVDSIAVGEGQTVKAGELLYTLHSGSLAQRIEAETTELQRLQLELSSQQLQDQFAEIQEQLAFDRASQDYSDAYDDAYKAYDDARIARGEALNEMREYYAHNKDTIDSWGSSPPVGASSLEGADIVAQYRRLQGEYDAADMVYEAARDSRRDGWKGAQRQMEDAEMALSWDTDRQAEIKELMIATQQKKVNELRQLEKVGGGVYTPIDGVVSKVMVTAGSVASESAAVMLARQQDDMHLVAEFAEDDMKYIEHGAGGTVAFTSGRPVKVTVDSIQDRTVTVPLPEQELQLGARGVLELVQKTDNYGRCVPMSALRSDGNQKYIMVLRERETVLGTQQVAERVDVQLQDNNETRAAVSGALQDSDRVIVSSNKAVRAGDTVRLLVS